MTTKTKLELMIASFQQHPIDLGYNDFNSTDCATRIHLRIVNPTDKWDSSPESRAVTELCLYVWANTSGTVSIGLRAHEVRSADIRDMELRLKMMKRLNAKANKAGFHFDNFRSDTSVYDQIVRCLDAIGIRKAVEYQGIGQAETFAPVGIAAGRIADAVDGRLAEQRLRKAA
jgi:hypothetical protein